MQKIEIVKKPLRGTISIKISPLKDKKVIRKMMYVVEDNLMLMCQPSVN